MLLLLARHGNTFETGDKVVWVGARTDLPLMAKGREQAAALGEGLQPIRSAIKRIVTGPLKRTREHADIAARTLHFTQPVEIDDRLREIDYGLWEAKTTDEIHALGGETELKAWAERGLWPASPGWSPAEGIIGANAVQLAHELTATLAAEEAALLVSSNGILRFFLKLVPGAFEAMAARKEQKVATGNCCALRHEGDVWRVSFWNRAPGDLGLN